MTSTFALPEAATLPRSSSSITGVVSMATTGEHEATAKVN